MTDGFWRERPGPSQHLQYPPEPTREAGDTRERLTRVEMGLAFMGERLVSTQQAITGTQQTIAGIQDVTHRFGLRHQHTEAWVAEVQAEVKGIATKITETKVDTRVEDIEELIAKGKLLSAWMLKVLGWLTAIIASAKIDWMSAWRWLVHLPG